MERCWTNMEPRYLTDAEATMRYTWVASTTKARITRCVRTPSASGTSRSSVPSPSAVTTQPLPAAIEAATLRQRLVEGLGWLVGAVE